MPTMMVQSAAIRRLRRDFEARRMKAALAPAGGVAKKPSRPSLCSSAPTSSPPARRADSDIHAPPSPFATSKPCAGIKSSSFSFSKGAHVRVRTPVGTMCTGQRLVLWLRLSAVVVSAVEEEEGHVDVVYTHYKNPRSSDPLSTVRVHKKDVRSMPLPPAAAVDTTASSSGSSVVTVVSDSARPSSQGKAPPLRPTVAGKKPLLKSIEEEMRRQSTAILASWL